jgi:hypothetical protein
MSAERWLPVVGYEGRYEVSDQGRVKSIARPDSRGRRRAERYLRPRRGARGHLSVALYAGAVRDDRQVHNIVLTAFVGRCPEGLEGCHWNDTPADNRLENLRWDTRSANVIDMVRNGKHAMANRTSCPRGHAYTPENTYTYPQGNRACRECRRAYREEHAEERRAKGREYMRLRRERQQTADENRKVA